MSEDTESESASQIKKAKRINGKICPNANASTVLKGKNRETQKKNEQTKKKKTLRSRLNAAFS